MASKLRAKTRSKRTSKPKRSTKKNVDRFAKNRATKAKERASRFPTGGESTGREKGIMASQKANKTKSLEQSIGSLDRRINNALEKGDTSLAKDLRSRQNKFTSKLGYQKAIKSGGVLRDSSGRITRTGEGNPILNTKGRGIFDETKEMDFIDPTRRIQNERRGDYNKMYPISGALNKGLNAIIGKDFKQRDIPYYSDMMPGEAYPLDETFGAGDPTEITDIDEVVKEQDYFGRSPLDEESSLSEIIERYRRPPEYHSMPGGKGEGITPIIKPKPKPKPDIDTAWNLPYHSKISMPGVNTEQGFNEKRPWLQDEESISIGERESQGDKTSLWDVIKDKLTFGDTKNFVHPRKRKTPLPNITVDFPNAGMSKEEIALHDAIDAHTDPKTGRYSEEYYANNPRSNILNEEIIKQIAGVNVQPGGPRVEPTAHEKNLALLNLQQPRVVDNQVDFTGVNVQPGGQTLSLSDLVETASVPSGKNRWQSPDQRTTTQNVNPTTALWNWLQGFNNQAQATPVVPPNYNRF